MKFIKLSKYHCLAIAMLSLAGCAVGPDFTTPASPKPERFTAESLSIEKVNEAAQEIVIGEKLNGAWWELFQSDAINSIVKMALENNPSLAAASFNLEQAQALATAQTGGLYPQAGISGGIGRQKYGEAFLGPITAPPPFTYFSIGPMISYSLDYTGGISRSIEQQSALVEYQKQQLNAASLAVTGNAVTLALKIASLQKQIETIRTVISLDKENLDLINESFNTGAVSRVAISKTSYQLGIDMGLLPPIIQELKAAQHALAILLGQPPANAKLPEINLANIRLPQKIPVELPSALAHNRPDILASEAQLHAATAAVGIATSNLYPQITLNASFSQQAMTANQIFAPHMSAWSLTSGIFAPIFDGGTLRAQQRAAIAAMRANAAKYQQTVLSAFAQVADSLEALQQDQTSIKAQKMVQESARDNNAYMQTSYHEGAIGILKVIDAERQYELANLALLKVNLQNFVDTTQLFLALGGSNLDIKK